MTKTIKNIVAGLLLVPALALGISLVTPVVGTAMAVASDFTLSKGVDSSKGTGVATTLFGDQSVFTVVVNILLFIIGAISVIMLIIGGIKYTVSNGDQTAVTSAKNTILYAIVGLVIAFLAFAAVNWVLSGLTSASTTA